MKYKYLEFEDYGPHCLTCGEIATFEGCYLHAGTFPVLSDKNRIRLPICNDCKIVCHECSFDITIPAFKKEYLRSIQTKTKLRKSNKLKAKIRQEAGVKQDINVKQDISDILNQIRNKHHSKNIGYFQDSISSILNDVVFSLEIGSQFAIKDVEEKLQGLIPSNMNIVNKYINKLSSLLLLVQLTRAVGLGRYEKEIMDKEINRLFGSIVAQSNKKLEIRGKEHSFIE